MQAVEHLPSKHEALSSYSSTTKAATTKNFLLWDLRIYNRHHTTSRLTRIVSILYHLSTTYFVKWKSCEIFYYPTQSSCSLAYKHFSVDLWLQRLKPCNHCATSPNYKHPFNIFQHVVSSEQFMLIFSFVWVEFYRCFVFSQDSKKDHDYTWFPRTLRRITWD
jgi:hypothetical protein